MKQLILFAGLLLSISSAGQDSIKLHFLYGSKPAKGHKDSEVKHFGGLKGGHVNIEANGRVLDFLPGKCPIFPKNKKPSGGFYVNNTVAGNESGNKMVTIVVPVSPDKLQILEKIFDSVAQKTPYDYAVFGMRCAAATYDVLSGVGLVKKISNRTNVFKHFYPKLLRKRLLKWAEKNNYQVITREGRPSRKWEKDSGLF